MATRAHTILANMIAAIEDITPDEQSGPGDVFRHAAGLDPDATISKDRSFYLAPSDPVIRDTRYISSTGASGAVVVLELGMGIAYQNTRNAITRILKDSERLLDALEKFQATYSADVLEVEISSGSIIGHDRTIISEFVLTVSYQLSL